MKRLTLLFTLFFALLSQSIAAPKSEREWRIVIENKYQRDKEIWGTYGQISEKTSIVKKSKSLSEKRNPAANMMLKNGKMVLIQPVTSKGITSYKVKQFPYKRKKGKNYQIEIHSKKEGFLDIYKEQLIAVLKKNKINLNNVDWNSIEIEKMNCKSMKRKFNCKLPLIIRSKPNS